MPCGVGGGVADAAATEDDMNLSKFSQLLDELFHVRLVDSGASVSRMRRCVTFTLALIVFAKSAIYLRFGANFALHVKYGNIFVGMGEHIDFIILPTFLIFTQILIVMIFNALAASKSNQKEMDFFVSYLRSAFEKLDPKMQRRLCNLIQLTKLLFDIANAFCLNYFTYVALTAYDMSVVSKLRHLSTLGVFLLIGRHWVCQLAVITVNLYLCYSSAMEGIIAAQEALKSQGTALRKKLQLLSDILSTIHKLNGYWKKIVFIAIAFNTMIIVTVAQSVLYGSMPPPLRVMCLLTCLEVFALCSAIILTLARMHAKIRECHKLLIALAISERKYRNLFIINHFVKHYLNLKVFTFWDAAHATYDAYREFVESTTTLFLLAMKIGMKR